MVSPRTSRIHSYAPRYRHGATTSAPGNDERATTSRVRPSRKHRPPARPPTARDHCSGVSQALPTHLDERMRCRPRLQSLTHPCPQASRQLRPAERGQSV
jgi:hypothetical protein